MKEGFLMNIFTAVMLIFSVTGLIDKMFGSKMGLSQSFDKGLLTMGTMSAALTSMSCVGVEFIQAHSGDIISAISVFPFDPSVLGGMLLASDMGGYAISSQLTMDGSMIVFNGIILSSLFGQFVTFQLPVFKASSGDDGMSVVLKGFIIGILVIPVVLFISGILLRMAVTDILIQLIPILIICLLLAAGLIMKPQKTLKGFNVFVFITQFFVYLTFLITIMGVFIPQWSYVDVESVHEIALIVLKSTIIVCGSIVMSELVLRFFRGRLQKIASRLGINEVSMIAILLNCATSLAILPLLPKMDKKGMMMNAAFSVSGPYFLGGQLGFVSSVVPSSDVTVYFIAKIICGFSSMLLVYIFYDKLSSF